MSNVNNIFTVFSPSIKSLLPEISIFAFSLFATAFISISVLSDEIAENLLSLKKETYQGTGSTGNPKQVNPNRLTPRHNLIKIPIVGVTGPGILSESVEYYFRR